MKISKIYGNFEEKVKKIYEFILNKVKFFINKDNFMKTKLVLCFLLSCVLSVICEYTIFRITHPEYISKIRMILVAIILMFVGIHFIFKLKKMYEFIHNHRYKIACAFLLFVMIFKLTGSSIVNFNSFIQPNIDNRKYHTLLGTARMVRTDEWATSTTYILSQGEGDNKFSYYADALRGTLTDMFTVSNSPVFDILMLGRPFQIAFILFGNERGLSLYWYIRLVAMLLGSYELCLVLTKRNKKVSLCGMIVITFSSAVQWWYCMDTLIWGQIVVVLLDKFMCTDKKRNKYLCALGLLVSGLSYIFVLYPAWQLSFGYLFLALVIWIMIKNIKYGTYKINKHDVIVICITLLLLALLLGRWYMLSKDTISAEMSTDYPGERQEVGGNAEVYLYTYFYNIFYTVSEYLAPCEYSGMLSFFPVPIILGIVYVFRNKKNLHFWIPMLAVSIFFSIWCIWGFPAWLANLTKMSMTTAGRVAIPLGTACIYMLVYLMGNMEKEDKLFNKKLTLFLAACFTLFIAYKAKTTIPYDESYPYLTNYKMLIAIELFGVAIYGLLNIDREKIRNYTIYVLIFLALVSGLMVNPVISTTDILYTKPVSIKMQEIRDEDPDAIWVVTDGGWYYNDYPLASGIRVLNSTAVYPNLELFETLLGDKAEEKRSIYNRYTHIILQIVDDEETDVELIYEDAIMLKLNYKDLSKVDVKYILSTEDFDERDFDEKFYEELYSEDGMYIYKVLDLDTNNN